MRWWLHERRTSHTQHMGRAAFEIMYSKQDVARSKTAESDERRAMAAAQGWQHVLTAIDEVTQCGCPRGLWPQVVAIALPEGATDADQDIPQATDRGRRHPDPAV